MVLSFCLIIWNKINCFKNVSVNHMLWLWTLRFLSQFGSISNSLFRYNYNNLNLFLNLGAQQVTHIFGNFGTQQAINILVILGSSMLYMFLNCESIYRNEFFTQLANLAWFIVLVIILKEVMMVKRWVCGANSFQRRFICCAKLKYIVLDTHTDMDPYFRSICKCREKNLFVGCISPKYQIEPLHMSEIYFELLKKKKS